MTQKTLMAITLRFWYHQWQTYTGNHLQAATVTSIHWWPSGRGHSHKHTLVAEWSQSYSYTGAQVAAIDITLYLRGRGDAPSPSSPSPSGSMSSENTSNYVIYITRPLLTTERVPHVRRDARQKWEYVNSTSRCVQHRTPYHVTRNTRRWPWLVRVLFTGACTGALQNVYLYKHRHIPVVSRCENAMSQCG